MTKPEEADERSAVVGGDRRSRFAAARVRRASPDHKLVAPHRVEWHVVEWPEGEAEPSASESGLRRPFQRRCRTLPSNATSATCDTTGWLAHTTRAAITGLRKRGYAVTRERIGAGESVYRISGAPAGSADRVVQTEAVDGRRNPKRKTKRAA
jgi:hypothetical protein